MLLVCLSVVTSSVCADSGQPPPPQGYEKLVARAVQEAALENYAEARSLFLEAHRRFPNARTLRALGMMEYEVKSYVAATEYLEQALRSEVRPLEGEMRTKAVELLNQARS